MPLWYPRQSHVDLIRRWLAARFFPEYEGASPQSFFGMIAGAEGRAALDSALNLPRHSYYRDVHDKAGALLRSMIKNHPFVDGNKRIGLVTTFDFLMMNDHMLFLATNREMVEFALEIAKSEPDMTWQKIAAWIRANCIHPSTTRDQLMARLMNRPTGVVSERVRYIEGILEDLRRRGS